MHISLQVKPSQSTGFTLIEMSIVLIIIGLIVGSILVGQELIRFAGIRATIGQLEKYNTAVNTFRLKYGYLPGDIPSSQASNFGLFNVTGALANSLACGDGNGIIQGYNSGIWIDGGSFGGEIAMFFLHLSQAGLIDGMYGAGGADVTVNGATATGGSTSTLPKVSVTTPGGTIGEILPLAKLGNANYFTTGSVNGKNYFVITGIWKIDTSYNVYSTNNLTPLDAYAIDNKIDDGLPTTGKVFALDTATTELGRSNGLGLTNASANNCINSSAYYLSNSVYANIQNCSLRFDFQ